MTGKTEQVTELRDAAMASKAWPYEEARRLLKRYPDGKPGGEAIIFETGYGPSGLPHIGTFNEVLRTTMVRNARLRKCRDTPTTLDRLFGRHGRSAQGARQCAQSGDAYRISGQAADAHSRPVRHA